MRDEGGWVELTSATAPPTADPGRRRRRILVVTSLLALVIVVGVAFGGLVAARQLAEDEAVAMAASTTSLLATAVIDPVLSDSLVQGTVGQTQSAREALDEVVRGWIVGTDGVVRVKLWTEEGMIVYSDEVRLIGRTYPLDRHDRQTLRAGGLDAQVADLSAPGNQFEQGRGELLEAFRGVATPGGTKLLVAVYFDYDRVVERSGQTWLRFAGITLASGAALVVLLLPVAAWLIRRLAREEAASRDSLRVELGRAVSDAADDRRRLAVSVSTGVMPDLASTASSLSAASRELSQTDPMRSRLLATAARTVRDRTAALRALLVDLHPETLPPGGLRPALDVLAVSARSRGLVVHLDVPDPTGLDVDAERLVFRVARECFANTLAYAHAGHLSLTLHGRVVEIADDGVGFEPGALLQDPGARRSGLRILVDLARTASATLAVRSAPSQGTAVRLRLPPAG